MPPSEDWTLAQALMRARTVGGPALGSLTCYERAEQIKELARRLGAFRGEFAGLSAALGATPADAADDFESGLRILRRYANAVSRDLGGEAYVVDGSMWAMGEAESVARDGALSAQLVAVGRPGVVVQINGFSLPARTVLEKFALAYLAGMPSIVRPSSRTAVLVAALVKRIRETDLFSEGALQVLTGPIELASGLTAQDLVSFTGTRVMARLLRDRIEDSGAQPQTEFATETLNCAVLGSDAEPGTEAFRLFVDRLVAAITLHTGQSTATPRRAFVPEHLIGDVADAVAAELASVEVGHPADPGVGMGPLIDVEHRLKVQHCIEMLRRAADVVFDGDPDAGAFMSPTLLRARSATGRSEIHEIEAFGPVSTLIPYRAVDDLSAGLALGRGGLTSWIVTGDPHLAHELTRAVAPWHAKLQVIDPERPPARDPEPGSADCLRRLRKLMAEVTVEASPRLSGAVTNRWVPGADRTVTTTSPLRLYLRDLRVGDSTTLGPRKVSRADIDGFAELTGDHYYAHTDDEAAARNPLFGGVVAHGYLVVSLATGMFVTPEPGPVLANRGMEHLRFLAPVRPGDEITVTLTAKEITAVVGADRGEVRWQVEVTNQRRVPVVRYDLLTVTAAAPG